MTVASKTIRRIAAQAVTDNPVSSTLKPAWEGWRVFSEESTKQFIRRARYAEMLTAGNRNRTSESRKKHPKNKPFNENALMRNDRKNPAEKPVLNTKNKAGKNPNKNNPDIRIKRIGLISSAKRASKESVCSLADLINASADATEAENSSVPMALEYTEPTIKPEKSKKKSVR